MKRSVATFVATLLIATAACSDSTGPGVHKNGGSDLGDMTVGAVRVLTFAQVSDGLRIPADLASAQFVVILGNTNVSSSIIPSYSVNGDWQAPQSLLPAASLLAPRSVSSPVSADMPIDRGAAFEARLRQFERTRLSLQAARTARDSRIVADRLVPLAAVAPAVGAKMSLRVVTSDAFAESSATNSCKIGGFVTTTGTVRAVGTHSIVVSDDQSPPGGFTDADFSAVASEFDTVIYPTDSAYFGTPTDIDGNGHVIIYFTPAVNKMTPANDAVNGYVGGFFFAGDLFDSTKDPPNGCRSSNEGEIFYVLAPDPNGVFGNTFDTQFVREVTHGTVAHEFQHMINAGNRYELALTVPGISFETTWLDEGLAHFAEDAVGRARVGFTPTHTVTLNDLVQLQQSDPALLQAYFLENVSRVKFYVERPDTTGPIVAPAKAAANLASRGAAWALLRYVADWFSGGDPHTVTRKLVAGPDTGTVNLVKSAGVPLDTILERWLITMYTDHTGIQHLDPVYNYQSYALRQVVSALSINNGPSGDYLPIQVLGNGESTLQSSVPASSGSYFLTSLSTGGARTIKITNPDGSAATDPGGRVYVIRQE